MRIYLFFISATSLRIENKTASFPQFWGKLAVFLFVFVWSFSYSMVGLNDQLKDSLSFAGNPDVFIQGEVIVYEQDLSTTKEQEKDLVAKTKNKGNSTTTLKSKNVIARKALHKSKVIQTKYNPTLIASNLKDLCLFLGAINQSGKAIICNLQETLKAFLPTKIATNPNFSCGAVDVVAFERSFRVISESYINAHKVRPPPLYIA